MNPLMFTRAGDSSMLLLWFYPLQAQMFFCLQMVVLIAGVAWCVALASTVFFGGWYAHTHPTTGNDHVIRRVTRLLWFLTFGLTDFPSSESEERGCQRRRPERPNALLRDEREFLDISTHN